MLKDRVNQTARRVPAWLVYVLGILPAGYFLFLGLSGGLGAEPIKALEHELGEFALKLLVAGLCITPLRKYLGVNLLKFRRAIGIMTFVYVALHLLVWLVLDVQIASQIWADIVKRPYITVGMGAFALMIPLAVTSNAYSVRRMGVRWRKLHKLTYGIAVLGALHFIMLSKGLQLEPLIYMGIVLILLALRIPSKKFALPRWRMG
ncbi:protein-methionine-sulfoxide reductase heme-binding subunit MsrQ [Planktotalea arctica]|uniref:protein-methionine-sulfoxide reductase heme-binding subunit MsrQ n=1 Tax=Planktotalea arctica TaxID=1481893 RepID=UPI000A1740F7|nr:protein-methionine-sulfoxide reductase heme-binding subunit MsrQ [Planktotalea arctica]